MIVSDPACPAIGGAAMKDLVPATDTDDLLTVLHRLRGPLSEVHGKLRVTDALELAGFTHPSFHRSRLLTRAMRNLGWDRTRLRIDGKLSYVYARGSLLEREGLLVLERGAEDQLLVKRNVDCRDSKLRPDADWALDWLRGHNAMVRFESDGTVSVTVQHTKRRCPMLVTAIIMVKDAIEAGR